MSNTTPKTPAALMAECCRLLFFDEFNGVTAECDAVYLCLRDGITIVRLDPDSLDSLARLIAAMSGEQREAYDWAMAYAPALSTSSGVQRPSTTMLAPTATHLAAIAAALGVSANG